MYTGWPTFQYPGISKQLVELCSVLSSPVCRNVTDLKQNIKLKHLLKFQACSSPKTLALERQVFIGTRVSVSVNFPLVTQFLMAHRVLHSR